jgi:hypothetical protein
VCSPRKDERSANPFANDAMNKGDAFSLAVIVGMAESS